MEEVIVIVGPTCSGKTYLSLNLASMLSSEIISADSRQIFKFLNIGTAKPTADQLKSVNHYFVDELNPDSDFNASMFAEEAEIILERLIEFRIRIPIAVGGSGLYVKALVDGISESAETNNELREELLELRKKFGNDYLYEELKKVDKISADKMLPQNWKRVMRALEVSRITGKAIWQHHDSQPRSKKFNYHQIGLLVGRENVFIRTLKVGLMK